MTGILSAAEIILITRFHAGQVLEAMRTHHPTVFPLVPAICEAISNELEREEKPSRLMV
jgi:long-subunit acyl-CoA synthetase (AMP-forming)